MPEYALSEFHETLRVLLGDGGDLSIGYDFEDGQLNAALRSVVKQGFLPCLAISATDPDKLAAPPPNPDTWGYLVAKAAHLMMGGQSPVSYKTRALSVFQDPAARRDSLTFLETMLSDIDARGNLCGTAEDTGNKGLFATAADLATYCKVGRICTGEVPCDGLPCSDTNPLPPF